MTEYGCQVTNKFGLPSDDDDEYDDPRELIQKVSQIAAKKKEEKSVKPAQPTKPVAAPISAVPKTDGAGRGARGGRGRGRGGAGRPRDGGDRVSNENGDRSGDSRRGGPRRGGERGAARPAGRGGRGGFTRENREGGEEVKDQQVAEDGHDTRAPRRRGGFTLGGGSSGGRGGARGGRGRQFDRQSGSDRTGVRAFEKKDGHGKGNWGDQKDELAGETENIAPEAETAEPEVPREKTAEEIAFEAEQAALAKQKTLKEFRAATAADTPKFNTRKAGEGVADNFGKLIPMKKEVIPDREEDEVVVIHKASRKQVLDISITFRNDRPEREQRNDRDRERSDRPARGGPRGGRGGRGGQRSGGQQGGRHQTTPFNASEDAFPALGAK